MIQLNQDSLVTLLLCSDLGLDVEMKKRYKPYTRSQWNKLAERILNSSIQKPSNLLNIEKEVLKDKLLLDDEEINRIIVLLKRGGNIAIEIEKLESVGIHITTRAEKNYPQGLKKVLKEYSPPIIYYSGNLDLANKKSVAIVGSRDVDDTGALFTKKFAVKCAKEGYVIVSGGAKGVDSIAENTSIGENGYAISIVSHELNKKIREKAVRNSILEGRLLAMSTVNPNSRFTVYAAMDRNKYIYGLSQGAVVVSSSDGKGGTWTGAVQNLKKKWVSLYVRNDKNIPLGNQKLIKLGGKPINLEMFEESNISIEEFFKDNNIDRRHYQEGTQQLDIYSLNKEDKGESISKVMEEGNDESLDVYGLVLPYIKKALIVPKNQNELSEILNIHKIQISTWIGRAIEEGQIKRLKDPVRYALKEYQTIDGK